MHGSSPLSVPGIPDLIRNRPGPGLAEVGRYRSPIPVELLREWTPAPPAWPDYCPIKGIPRTADFDLPDPVVPLFDALAAGYAATVLGITPIRPATCWRVRCYNPGDRMNAHTDAPHTVSLSVTLQAAAAGGELCFQGTDRTAPPRPVEAEAGNVILWPSEWWHQVNRVRRGRRYSIVRFYDEVR